MDNAPEPHSNESSSEYGVMAMLCIDQRQRWGCGDNTPVESYLEKYPQLNDAPDILLDLVYTEIMLRQRRGESPKLAEYLNRFPDLHDDLERLFEVHDVLESEEIVADPDLTQDLSLGKAVDTPWDVGGLRGEAELPRQMGGYEILEELGRGGMGVVFRARQIALDRAVALKVILTGRFAGDTEVARFHREAEAAAKLDHPCIVPVFDVGHHEGVHYFSMRLVSGTNLAEVLKDGPLPQHTAAELLANLADGVHFAHQQGVIHRDLKPRNVLIDEKSKPRITDFGLAFQLDRRDDLTKTGAVLGTPDYISPEQANGTGLVSCASDVFSLGAILYHTITGKAPFQGGSVLQVLNKVVREDPPAPRTLNKIDSDLEVICLKCLQKDPADRYASAGEVADELRRYLCGQPILARAPRPMRRLGLWCRRNRALAALAAGVATLLLALLIGSSSAAWVLYLARLDAERAKLDGEKRLYEAKIAEASLNSNSGRMGQREAAIRSAEIAAGLVKRLNLGPTADLRARNEMVGGLTKLDLAFNLMCPLPLESGDLSGLDPGLQRYAVFEPGRRGLEIVIRRFADSVVTQRIENLGHSDPIQLRFGPKGKLLAGGGLPGGITPARVWDLESGKDIFSVHTGQEWYYPSFDFSPDGRCFVYALRDGTIAIEDLNTGRELIRFQSLGIPICVRYSPNGTYVAISTEAFIQVVTTQDGVTRYKLAAERGYKRIEWSPDERLIAHSGRDGIIWNLASKSQRTIAYHEAGVNRVAFNHRGDLLVSAGNDGTSVIWDVASGRELLRTDGQALRFSDDGKWLAFGRPNSHVGRWRVVECAEFKLLHDDHIGGVLALGPEGRLAAVAAGDGTQLWDLRAGKRVGLLPLASACVAFARSGKELVTGGRQGLKLWEIDWSRPGAVTVALKDEIELPSADPVDFVSFSSDARYILAKTTMFTVNHAFVIDRGTTPLGIRSFGQRSLLFQLQPSVDNRWVVASPRDSDAQLWSATDLDKETRRFPIKEAFVAFSPDGKLLGLGARTEYQIYSMSDVAEPSKPIRVIPKEPLNHELPCIIFSGDSRVAALTDSVSSVALYSTQSWEKLASLPVPNVGVIRSMHFSRSGETLAACTKTGYILSWNLRLLRARLAQAGLDWAPSSTSGQPETATHFLELGVKLEFGDLWRWWGWHGNQLFDDQKWDRGTESFERLLDCLRDRLDDATLRRYYAEFSSNLAGKIVSVPARSRANTVRAIELARECLEIRPDDLQTRNTLGTALYRAGRYSSAIAELESLGRSDRPEAPWALYIIAMSQWQLDDHDASQNTLERAVSAHQKYHPNDYRLGRLREEAGLLFRQAAEPNQSLRKRPVPGRRVLPEAVREWLGK